jgi:hypothetical protein
MLQGIQRRERRRRIARIAALVVAALVLLGGAATGAVLWLGRENAPAPAPAVNRAPAVDDTPVQEPATRPAPPENRPAVAPVAVTSAPRTIEPVASSDAFDTEMAAFLKRHHPDFVACRGRLTPATDATINLKVAFFVGASGAVEDVWVESMDRQAVVPLIECVRDIVAQGRFAPRPDRRPYESVLVL